MTTLQPSHITLTEDLTFIPLVKIGWGDCRQVGAGRRPTHRTCGSAAARNRVSSGLLDVRSVRSISGSETRESGCGQRLCECHVIRYPLEQCENGLVCQDVTSTWPATMNCLSLPAWVARVHLCSLSLSYWLSSQRPKSHKLAFQVFLYRQGSLKLFPVSADHLAISTVLFHFVRLQSPNTHHPVTEYVHSYVVHSSFLASLPIHLAYLLTTTDLELRPLLSGLRCALMHQLTSASGSVPDIQHRKFPTVKAAFIMIALSIFYSLPSLLWFAAVPLASYDFSSRASHYTEHYPVLRM